MDINDEIVELVTQIEYIIGSECFNSKSTWQHGNRIIQGRQFRYPVHYKHKTFDSDCDTNSIVVDVDPADLKKMNYHFGANQLFIGEGIINVLNMLEKRYNISINELEKRIKEENN